MKEKDKLLWGENFSLSGSEGPYEGKTEQKSWGREELDKFEEGGQGEARAAKAFWVKERRVGKKLLKEMRK